MLNYVTVGTNDRENALVFYDALFATIGAAKIYDNALGGRIYGQRGAWMFCVTPPYDGQPATTGNGSMSGFALPSTEEVDKFHATALALGGTCDGAPGQRGPSVYFAYFRDLDGNKLCGYKAT